MNYRFPTRSSAIMAACASALLALPSLVSLAYREIHSGVAVVRASAAEYTQFTLTLTEVHRQGPSVTSAPVRTARNLVIAQRSDGARVEQTVMFPGQPQEYQFREIVYPDMRKIRAADSVGLKVTGMPASAENITHRNLLRPSAESACSQNRYGRTAMPSVYKMAGKEMIGDLVAIKFVREDPHTEVWHAPALDCEAVRRLTIFRGCCEQGFSSNPAFPVSDSSEIKFVGYTLGEPDKRLFDHGALKESPPGEVWRQEWRRAKYPESYIEKQAADLAKRDEAYWKTRSAAGVRPE